jgi:hypothetical protein
MTSDVGSSSIREEVLVDHLPFSDGRAHFIERLLNRGQRGSAGWRTWIVKTDERASRPIRGHPAEQDHHIQGR